MHIHFATAGKNTDPIIKGLKTIPGIEKVYLLYSRNYQESAEEIEKYLDKGATPVELIPVNEYDFQSVMTKISDIHEKEKQTGNHKYTINVTGGTKPMAFAAYSSAYFIGATVYYIQDKDDIPLEEQLLTLVTTRAPKSGKAEKKTREILRFIYERTAGGESITSGDIEERFGMKKQQVSYYIRNLKTDQLISTEDGMYDERTGKTNYRYKPIRLTQQGMMEARFVRGD